MANPSARPEGAGRAGSGPPRGLLSGRLRVLSRRARRRRIQVLPAAARLRYKSPQHALLKPSGLWGHGVGVLATMFMLLNFIYPLRKRLALFKGKGSIAPWLRFHVFVGIMSPLIILFHTAFQWGNQLATSTYVSVVIVVATGLVGRYFYGWVRVDPADAAEAAALRAEAPSAGPEDPARVAAIRGDPRPAAAAHLRARGQRPEFARSLAGALLADALRGAVRAPRPPPFAGASSSTGSATAASARRCRSSGGAHQVPVSPPLQTLHVGLAVASTSSSPSCCSRSSECMSGSACVSVFGGCGHDALGACGVEQLPAPSSPYSSFWLRGAPLRAQFFSPGPLSQAARVARGTGEVLQVPPGEEGPVREAVPRLPHGARRAGRERRRLSRTVARAEARRSARAATPTIAAWTSR